MKMDEESRIRLSWDGRASADNIQTLLGEPGCIEIRLAPEYNHALYSRLHSAAARAGVEEIDRSGGAELLETVAGIRGLEDFSQLVAPLAQSGASVHIESPPRVIIEIPD